MNSEAIRDQQLKTDVALQVTGDYARCICEVLAVVNTMRDQRSNHEVETMLMNQVESMVNTYIALRRIEEQYCHEEVK